MDAAIKELLQRTAKEKMALDDAEWAFSELRRDLRVMIERLESRYVWEAELDAMITNQVCKMRDSSWKGE